MDIVLGIIFLALIAYGIRGVHRFLTSPARSGPPPQATLPSVAPTDTRTLEQRLEDREDEAFIDGLIIGSYYFGDFWDRGDEEEIIPEEIDLWYDDYTELWDDLGTDPVITKRWPQNAPAVSTTRAGRHRR